MCYVTTLFYMPHAHPSPAYGLEDFMASCILRAYMYHVSARAYFKLLYEIIGYLDDDVSSA
jgi:hypothetical protein